MPPSTAPAAASAFAAQAGGALQACRFDGDERPDAPQVWAIAWPTAAPPGTRPETARAHARAAARGALALLLADALGLPAGTITLDDQRGRAPRAMASDPAIAPRVATLGLSISHDSAASLIAWRQGGPVGVDLQDLPDWPRAELLRLARDYLGDAAAQSLAAQAEGLALQRAFATAWAAQEAQLKCLGEPLAEWTPELAARQALCETRPLTLPDSIPSRWAGSVSWR